MGYFTNFEFAGEKLSDYKMMVCKFDGSGGLETVSSGADVTFQQIRPGGSNRFLLYASTYESALSATFQICKNPFLQKNRRNLFFLSKRYPLCSAGCAEKTDITVLKSTRKASNTFTGTEPSAADRLP